MTNLSPVTVMSTRSRTGDEVPQLPSGVARVVELPVRIDRRRVDTLPAPARLGALLGWSDAMKAAFDRIERVAPTDLPVVIEGPSGTGKELTARAIHDESSRHDKPFVALNCGALSPSLIESELFGYVKGAFTGAMADKKGAFEACEGGTLFLDEIGELPLEMQPKLLRVLETMTVRRVGDVREVPVDVRIVAATHRDLAALVEQGLFREDLYHRLVVLTVRLRPLVDRPLDVLGLARTFAGPKTLTRAAEEKLLGHAWAGNVRELKNTLVRASVMTDGSDIDTANIELVGPRAQTPHPQTPNLPVRSSVEAEQPVDASHSDDGADLRVDPESQRQRYIRLLRECRNNRAEAARRLGVARSTFHAQLKRLGIPLKFSDAQDRPNP